MTTMDAFAIGAFVGWALCLALVVAVESAVLRFLKNESRK